MRSARRCARLIDQAADLTNAIIFCNRKRDVATLHRSLERHGYSVGALHGDMDQYARLKTLDSFRDGQIKLLVASDVAARGLDIPAVSHIFNFDVPTHSEDYVHRIGRTGRAGRAGLAQTIVTRAEAKYMQSIEKLTGKEIEWSTEAVQRSVFGDEAAEEAPSRERPARSAGRGRTRQREPRGEKRAEGGEQRQERNRHPRGERAPRRNDRDNSAQASRHGRSSPPPHAENLEDASRAVGFSDHVPDFLLRPVRLPREEPQVEEV